MGRRRRPGSCPWSPSYSGATAVPVGAADVHAGDADGDSALEGVAVDERRGDHARLAVPGEEVVQGVRRLVTVRRRGGDEEEGDAYNPSKTSSMKAQRTRTTGIIVTVNRSMSASPVEEVE